MYEVTSGQLQTSLVTNILIFLAGCIVIKLFTGSKYCLLFIIFIMFIVFFENDNLSQRGTDRFDLFLGECTYIL